jgi:hypothetical protein
LHGKQRSAERYSTGDVRGERGDRRFYPARIDLATVFANPEALVALRAEALWMESSGLTVDSCFFAQTGTLKTERCRPLQVDRYSLAWAEKTELLLDFWRTTGQ